MALLRLALAAMLIVVGCSPAAAPRVIAGYPVGDRVDGDQPFATFARATLDGLEPGHPLVATTEIYRPDYRMKNGDRYLMARSGGDTLVVVLRLADDTVRAFLVGCGVAVDPDRCALAQAPV